MTGTRTYCRIPTRQRVTIHPHALPPRLNVHTSPRRKVHTPTPTASTPSASPPVSATHGDRIERRGRKSRRDAE